MTKEEAIIEIQRIRKAHCDTHTEAQLKKDSKTINALDMAIQALKQQSRKGEWLRMSNLPEQLDDRYKCSYCENVVHHIDKRDLYTFNRWCGRCGSDNGRHINYEVQ